MPARPSRSAMPRKKRPKEEAAETPLEVKRQAVAAEQAKLQAQMEKYKKLIEDAPKLAEERRRRQREEYVTRAARTENRPTSRAALPDRRYELNASVVPRQRRLRAERNQGRMTFFVLLLVLAGVACWVYFSMLKGAF